MPRTGDGETFLRRTTCCTLGRCFVPAGVRVSCTTMTGSAAWAGPGHAAATRRVASTQRVMPRKLGGARHSVNVQRSIRVWRWSVELDVRLSRERLRNRLPGLPPRLDTRFEAF